MTEFEFLEPGYVLSATTSKCRLCFFFLKKKGIRYGVYPLPKKKMAQTHDPD
jgi:hypothetical protein